MFCLRPDEGLRVLQTRSGLWRHVSVRLDMARVVFESGKTRGMELGFGKAWRPRWIRRDAVSSQKGWLEVAVIRD